jgi:hypothetical protein
MPPRLAFLLLPARPTINFLFLLSVLTVRCVYPSYRQCRTLTSFSSANVLLRGHFWKLFWPCSAASYHRHPRPVLVFSTLSPATYASHIHSCTYGLVFRYFLPPVLFLTSHSGFCYLYANRCLAPSVCRLYGSAFPRVLMLSLSTLWMHWCCL